MARPLSEMTAVIAGATAGMGLETAAQLAEAGVARLILNGRDGARAEQARAAVLARAPQCDVHLVVGDASKDGTIAAIAAAADKAGGAGIFVHAVPGSAPPAPFDMLDPECFAPLVEAHLMSAFKTTKALLPLLISSGGGTIIFIASDAAKIPTPGESVHGALMAAIVMFARTLALENARNAVRVHALTPSIVLDTMSHDRMMADPFSAKLFETAKRRAVLGTPRPCDIAAAAVFLCQPVSARTTGQVITINGGLAIA